METFIYMLIVSYLSYALTPKPKIPNATAGNLDIPVPKLGQPITVVFGDVWIDSPAISYYGNPVTKAIKSKSAK